MFEFLTNFSLDVIARLGYGGIFVLSLLESAAIPIPSEIVVPFAGFLTAKGLFDFWAVVLFATAANLVGSMLLFFIGRSGGRRLLEHYGKYVFISKSDLELGDRWFQKYGGKVVFFGRLLPVVRTFVSLPAGIARMSFGIFTFFTFLGALPWNFALAYAGLKAGENWDLLHKYFRQLDYVIVGIVIVLVVWYIMKRKNKS